MVRERVPGPCPAWGRSIGAPGQGLAGSGGLTTALMGNTSGPTGAGPRQRGHHDVAYSYIGARRDVSNDGMRIGVVNFDCRRCRFGSAITSGRLPINKKYRRPSSPGEFYAIAAPAPDSRPLTPMPIFPGRCPRRPCPSIPAQQQSNPTGSIGGHIQPWKPAHRLEGPNGLRMAA
jgi:hypothetical protein